MSSLNFTHVRVLLFDPAYMNRQTTIGALQTLGFVDVEPVARARDLEAALVAGGFELLIAEVRGQDDQVCDIIRKARHRALGNDPFLVMLLTTWDLNAEIVQAVINCGADDLLARPYSIAQIRQRICGAVLQRKPFVVTADYIGPTRRGAGRGAEDDELIPVPNPLRARITGEAEPADANERTWGKVLRWKAIRLGRQLEAAARVLADSSLQFGNEKAVRAAVERIGGIVSDLGMYTGQAGDPAYTAISRTCGAFNELLAARGKGADAPEELPAIQESARKICDRVRVLKTPDKAFTANPVTEEFEGQAYFMV